MGDHQDDSQGEAVDWPHAVRGSDRRSHDVALRHGLDRRRRFPEVRGVVCKGLRRLHEGFWPGCREALQWWLQGQETLVAVVVRECKGLVVTRCGEVLEHTEEVVPVAVLVSTAHSQQTRNFL